MQRLIDSLLRRGWILHFVGPVPPASSHPRLVFHPVRVTGDGQPSPRTLARCIRAAFAVCLRHRLRHVWTFGSAYAALLAPLRLVPGSRMATFLHGSLAEQERARGAGLLRRAAAEAVERTAVAASDAIIAVSRELAERAGGKAIVLPNDVHVAGPAPRPEDARKQLGLPLDAFLVGYAGSITPIKGLETLVQAAALLPTARVALQGFSAEGTPYERWVRGRVAELCLGPRVHLLAWAPSARPLLSALDVLVVPSRHEGCPNVLLEAMALGRPCLGARSGGIEEMLVHDDLLFPAGDAAGLAARLKELQEQPRERERLASLGRARAAAYDFDWDERAVAALESAFGRGR
jgi:glycosyltransferase involved in cell wall biosynthesis